MIIVDDGVIDSTCMMGGNREMAIERRSLRMVISDVGNGIERGNEDGRT
jgi:hypothetical protein